MYVSNRDHNTFDSSLFEDAKKEFDLDDFVLKYHSLLFPLPPEKYKFSHKSIFEYFLARIAFEDINFCNQIDFINRIDTTKIILDDGLRFYIEICIENLKEVGLLDKSNQSHIELDYRTFQPSIISGFVKLSSVSLMEVIDEKNVELLRLTIDKVEETKKDEFSYNGLKLVVSKIRAIHKINWSYQKLTTKNLEHLVEIIPHFLGLQVLDLSHNQIEDVSPLMKLDRLPEIILLDHNPISLTSLKELSKKFNQNFIDTLQKDGTTYLYKSVQEEDVNKVQDLLDHQANPFKNNQNFDTPIQLAWQKGNKEILDIFYNKGFQWRVLIVCEESFIAKIKKMKFSQKQFQIECLSGTDLEEWKKKILNYNPHFVLVSEFPDVPKELDKNIEFELTNLFSPFENKQSKNQANCIVYGNLKWEGYSNLDVLWKVRYTHLCKNLNTKDIEDYFEEWKYGGLDKGKLKKKYMSKTDILTFTNSLGMEFVYIPSGEYKMGCSDAEYQAALKLADELGLSAEHKKDYLGYLEREKPSHRVRISKGFWMSKYEVTKGEFKKFVQATGYKTEAEKGDGAFGLVDGKWKQDKNINWKNTGFDQSLRYGQSPTQRPDDHPVVCVSWNDAKAYCEWVSSIRPSDTELVGLRYASLLSHQDHIEVPMDYSETKPTLLEYRLPTEAEWEYAARAGTETMFYWGDEKPEKPMANCADESFYEKHKNYYYWKGYNDGYVYTSPVGSFPPNPFGLYDMLGNVNEWCEDWYDEKFYEKCSTGKAEGQTFIGDQTFLSDHTNAEDNKENSKDEIIVIDPFNNTDDKYKIVRGGSWDCYPRYLRVSDRSRYYSDSRLFNSGFRVVLPVTAGLNQQ